MREMEKVFNAKPQGTKYIYRLAKLQGCQRVSQARKTPRENYSVNFAGGNRPLWVIRVVCPNLDHKFRAEFKLDGGGVICGRKQAGGGGFHRRGLFLHQFRINLVHQRLADYWMEIHRFVSRRNDFGGVPAIGAGLPLN